MTPACAALLPRPRRFFAGSGLSALAGQCLMVALPLQALATGEHASAVGIVLALALGPRAIAPAIAGTVPDRWPGEQVIGAAQFARAAALAWLTFRIGTGGGIGDLFAVALIVGLSEAFVQSGENALLAKHASATALASGNAVLARQLRAASCIVPLLTVAAGCASDIVNTLLLLAASAFYLAAGLGTASLPRRPADDAGREAFGIAITKALGAIGHDPALRLFLAAAAISALAAGPLSIALPMLAAQSSRPAATLGLLLLAGGIGAVSGALLAQCWQPQDPLFGRLLLGCGAASAAGVVVLTGLDTPAARSGLLFAIGLSNAFAHTHFMTWLQRRTEPSAMARMSALLSLAWVGPLALSMLALGPFMDQAPETVLIVAGGVSLTLLVAAAGHPAAGAVAQLPQGNDAAADQERP